MQVVNAVTWFVIGMTVGAIYSKTIIATFAYYYIQAFGIPGL